MTTSALYRGHLVHVRTDTHARRFRYPICVAALDLAALDRLHARLRLFSYNRRNLFSLHDRDYGQADDPALDLRGRHRAVLAAHDLPTPARTTLVTQLRTADYVFNPVSFFLGHDRADRLETVVAEVNNNYGGRHRYVLGPDQRQPDRPGRARFVVDKTFFVSPFIHGPARYQFGFADRGADAAGLDIRMDVARPDQPRPFFVAHLRGDRRPLTDRALLAAAVRYPLMSVQVIALIYGEALLAHARGVSFRRPGPDHAPT